MNATTYEVKAIRGAGSIFGAAVSVCKDKEGKPLEFNSEEEARQYKQTITEGLRTSNVTYVVQPKVS